MLSPTHWEDLVTYQVMPDRFNNGDASNDFANIQIGVGSSQANVAWTHDIFALPSFSHGGDLRGLIDRLDYLADLGVTLLYVNPIFGSNGAYHGFCMADPTVVNPNLGTLDDARELVREAHLRGMRVMLDVVVNHLCGPNNGETTATWAGDGTAAARAMCAADRHAFQMRGDAVQSVVPGEMDFGPGFFPPLDAQEFFTRCGAQPGKQRELQSI